MRPTASIVGVVRSWSTTLDEMSIQVEERSLGYSRGQRFFRTGGVFTIADLPAGHYTIAAGADGMETSIGLDLAAGEREQVELALAPLTRITGRVTDHLTKQPLANVFVSTISVGASTGYSRHRAEQSKSDHDGRFTIENVPVGKLRLLCNGREIHMTYAVREVMGSGTVDVGDIPTIRRSDELSGVSGMVLTDLDDVFETSSVVVEKVTPDGPAARAGIEVGDVITSINGLDTTGYQNRECLERPRGAGRHEARDHARA